MWLLHFARIQKHTVLRVYSVELAPHAPLSYPGQFLVQINKRSLRLGMFLKIIIGN